ncbi:hypothetical protein CYLTODRAFT_335751, partial [Cylindrobasidium torrendii FP15055 ss-10]
LKPEPPEPYDGTPDVRKMLRFVQDGTDYVREGGVHKKLRVKKLSRFLRGSAEDWYISHVSGNPYEWRLNEFFTALYNYCFPATFRQEQRRKLARTMQGDLPIKKHTMRLEELFNSAGVTDEKEKTLKLWDSLRPKLARALMYRYEILPDTTTYNEI